MSVAVRFQQVYDTAANWTANNPVLLSGEFGIESDTGYLKAGDGATAWTSLDYMIDGSGGGGTWGSITGTLSAQTDLQTALNGKQPLDADLTAIAALTATTDSFMQAKAGAWSARTIAQVKTDLGLTGTNSGDQTTIVGITGTKAQFDTACTDGNFLYVGDAPTAHTHVAANITDFAAAVAANSAVAANTAKVTNATHTGDVTGATALTIAVKAVTLAKMDDMATASLIYRKTAGLGAPEVNSLATLKTDLGLIGTNSGDQTITLTGDVTGSGMGSFAATIAADAVTNTKLANMSANSVKVRAAGTLGDPSDLVLSLNTLLGRGSSGDVAGITLGTNLSMSGTTLNAAGGSSTFDYGKTIAQRFVSM